MSSLVNLSENVIRIQTIGSEGWATAFLINHENQQFWVTAKHVFEEKNTKKARVFTSQQEYVEFSITDVKLHDTKDIMYFKVGEDFPLKNLEGINYCVPNYDCYGNDVYCLGFPYNVSVFDTSIKGKDIPCIKKGILSSVNGDDNYFVDKMLAAGFSGGCVLMEYEGEYKVIGVISNGSFQHIYKEDTQGKFSRTDCPFVVPDELCLCVNIANFEALLQLPKGEE